MRILITADAELPVPPRHYGGIERIIDSLITEFRSLGHEVGLVAHRDSAVDCDCFQPWPGETSKRPPDSVRNALTLYGVAKRFRPDLLHSFSRLLWLLPLEVLPADLAFPMLMSYQREPSGRTVSLTRKLFGDRLSFTACSAQLAEKGKARGGGSWTPIHNFVDLRNFDFTDRVKPNAPLVFLSRIEPIKGCHEAIAIAKASGRRLLIAGNRVEAGSAAGYWDREIKPHLGKDGIEYIGPVDDLQKNQLLGNAAALLVPIEWDEPFGIVFAEALACGTPIISTARGAVPEIIDDGIHGFLIGSTEEGIQAVEQLGEINRLTCRRRVEEHFSVRVVARQYLELYARISNK